MKKLMRSRALLISGVIAATSALTGCGGIDLTDEQNRLIAEYSADLLLKYDADYQERYGGTVEKDRITTEEPVSSENTEQVIEPGTEEVTEPDSGTEDTPPAATTEDVVIPEPGTGEGGNPIIPSGDTTDIAEIVGVEDISIIYNRYMILDRYPSLDHDGAFIYLEANPGYKLLIVKFDIQNQAAQPVELDLLNTEIDYHLVMNGGKSARPMLTILIDDLGTFRNTIPGNSDQSAVLAFQISDSLVDQIEQLNLRVTYDNTDYVIPL